MITYIGSNYLRERRANYVSDKFHILLANFCVNNKFIKVDCDNSGCGDSDSLHERGNTSRL
jgi:hypothetical protein